MHFYLKILIKFWEAKDILIQMTCDFLLESDEILLFTYFLA